MALLVFVEDKSCYKVEKRTIKMPNLKPCLHRRCASSHWNFWKLWKFWKFSTRFMKWQLIENFENFHNFRNFQWEEAHLKCFLQVKAIISKNSFLYFLSELRVTFFYTFGSPANHPFFTAVTQKRFIWSLKREELKKNLMYFKAGIFWIFYVNHFSWLHINVNKIHRHGQIRTLVKVHNFWLS